ncbi:hypothetical protein tloyanaT_13380 [Thalassotalea loyana]|uniref:VRR-NUC domain-containing protein n=1 Tax=Thalassotalea loyana TaxID=280483 RepID=A0ABQ6HF19_9GAMM|nr:VRR-NUC domain-containing protein [Thalassotalea loyana]GLX85086.1 hypothetical protein tloyanaT_13380 [Thalassotalea loyana]
MVRRTTTRHIEDEHQKALITWSKSIRVTSSETLYDFLFAIPNGGKRDSREAARLKRQGVKAGVSDLFLPIPMNGYSGLWIELKRPIVKGQKKPSTSESQLIWLERMERVGYKTVLAYGWEQAKDAIEAYLKQQEKAA